jgi:hypothetical protein
MASSGVIFASGDLDYIEKLNALVAFNDDWATEIEVARDGEVSLSAKLSLKVDVAGLMQNLDINGYRVTSASDAVDLQDYVTLAQANGLIGGGAAPGDLNITDLSPGTASALQYIRINAGGTAIVGSTISTQKTVVVTAISRTAVDDDHVEVTAAGTTQTLPSSPSPGDEVEIAVGNFVNTVVGRNGSNIMSSAQDITLSMKNVTVLFRYIDASIGWKVIL